MAVAGVVAKVAATIASSIVLEALRILIIVLYFLYKSPLRICFIACIIS